MSEFVYTIENFKSTIPSHNNSFKFKNSPISVEYENLISKSNQIVVIFRSLNTELASIVCLEHPDWLHTAGGTGKQINPMDSKIADLNHN